MSDLVVSTPQKFLNLADSAEKQREAKEDSPQEKKDQPGQENDVSNQPPTATPSASKTLSKTDVLSRFEHVVLDEADKYFEYSYMDQLEALLGKLDSAKKHYMLFSATLPPQIERSVEGLFANKVKVVVGGRVNVLSSTEQRLVFCQSEEAKTIEMANVVNEGLRVPCLIFVQNKERVRQLHRYSDQSSEAL